MKKVICLFLMFVTCICFLGCAEQESVIRIHIRANSNNACDQEVKLMVRDDILDYITPLIADCENSEAVKNTLSENLQTIENIADNVLKENGYDYVSKAKINNEYFPTREYDGNVFPADYYDALIVELGEGVGDNWWCVAYPPLCFVGNLTGSKVKYKSKILELINKFWE